MVISYSEPRKDMFSIHWELSSTSAWKEGFQVSINFRRKEYKSGFQKIMTRCSWGTRVRPVLILYNMASFALHLFSISGGQPLFDLVEY